MHLSLEWQGALTFVSSPGSPAIELHSSTPGLPSPPEALAYAVMGCMAMDLVHVLEKGRHALRRMTVRFDGARAAQPPRRFTSMAIHFAIAGSVESAAVERALELSRTKYCSVWHTIRPDVVLTTTYVIEADVPTRPE